ncbi:MAG: saccharopine dehydrogenase [Ignavibacteria bacterium GWB2_35_12]|nr:MAG: saccharopine dehydrogenase [Ignavibacteria bacterium GWA2_35_8]OGU38683.1 MAG: saccharopine dehydrogenase [Ignavibacteria bacterium GWB2_35_12]OGU88814.1 MAG: saccharopine dehydrogenase [Ignavibacteria bacterium RIFOXYA2_FULL_35_10]OGV20899.1 MAG: saccharopine dehydrogenase [Ignavibacteria bacterium RIFOXYC2_FULL_35_21]
MKKVVVFGAGMVGSAMAIDLSKEHKVTSVDVNQQNLEPLRTRSIDIIIADFRDSAQVKEIVMQNDLVIGAVPGFLGFDFLKEIILTGKNIVDISFFPEDALQLDDLAKKNNITAVVDCGVAPGMSNIILGYHNKRMKVECFECYVGGLPVERILPYQYKAPFSPIDVIEEYTRPARLVINSKEVIMEALSEPEYIDFPHIGTLQAFNTDGLRSLIKTMNIPNMKEKTLRYPGHIDKIIFLKESGFFSDVAIMVDNKKVKPIDFTSKLLFDRWKLGIEEEEFTVMRIIIKGLENNKPKTYQYDLLDKYDTVTKTSSMARTTGYTATAVANLILQGKFVRKGLIPPEYISEDEDSFNSILSYLTERNVIYRLKKF